MTTLPSDLQRERLLTQILNSPEFNGSARYQELLRYLVDKSSKVSSLKESEIAREVFGKDANFDPATDPLIRSYISTLRKKLEHYYLTTEDQFEYRLEVPKGQYLVKYSTAAKSVSQLPTNKILPLVYPVIIAVLLGIFLFREFVSRSTETTSPNLTSHNPIWAEFKYQNYPTLIVIGNYTFLSEKSKPERRTFLRAPQINGPSELIEWTKREPEKFGGLEISDVSYVGTGAAIGVAEILKHLGDMTNVSLKLSSELKWDDFDNHNVIYVGSLKTLNKLDTLFSRTNLRYTLNPNSLEVKNASTDSSLAFNFDWKGGNYQKDYSIILKLRGSKNNFVLFLTGFSEVGVMESVKASTEEDFVSKVVPQFDKQKMSDPFLFELVSETEGVGYTVFRSEVKYFSLLQP